MDSHIWNKEGNNIITALIWSANLTYLPEIIQIVFEGIWRLYFVILIIPNFCMLLFSDIY